MNVSSQTKVYEDHTVEDQFSVPYTWEGSRHDRVLNELLKRERTVSPRNTDDRSTETFETADDRLQAFAEIVERNDSHNPQVLVSEFYLYDPSVEWRDETALELDIARFDRETQTVYCTETTGKNLESIRDVDDPAEKKRVVKQEAWEKGTGQINQLQEYMNRFGWSVEGQVAAFYQDGKRGETTVEVYSYTPEEV